MSGNVYAQEQFFNTSDEYPVWWGRIFSVSTESPVTKAIRADPENDRKLYPMYDLFERLSAVAESRRYNDSRACNVPLSVFWTRRARQRIPIFQIGFISEDCFSFVDIPKAVSEKSLPRNYSTNAKNAIVQAREILSAAIQNISFYRDGNWSDPQSPYSMGTQSYYRNGQTCSVDDLLAYKVDNEWYIRAAATNYNPARSVADGERHYLMEFVPRSGNTSLIMVHPSTETGKLEYSSTLTEAWQGTGYGVESLEFDDTAMPLSMAYNENIISVDLASDAVTVSNIAILALPMAMSLIPVAFVADLNTLGMFAYILVTDVFSTIPFLIKGAELVHSSTPKQTISTSFHGGNSTIGEAQIYVVVCRGENYFRNIGIAFITVAAVVMIVGVLLEVWARSVMKRRRRVAKDGEQVQGPFGFAAYGVTMKGLLGREETQKEHDYWEKVHHVDDILTHDRPSSFNDIPPKSQTGTGTIASTVDRDGTTSTSSLPNRLSRPGRNRKSNNAVVSSTPDDDINGRVR